MNHPCRFTVPGECRLQLHCATACLESALMLLASKCFSSILGVQRRIAGSIRDLGLIAV